MQPTTLTLHTAYQIGEVDPRIFGGFLEHMGRAVYQGVYEPEERARRRGRLSHGRAGRAAPLDMTAMRYPGGNFASGYHWQDGVGPREKRPTVRELAWQSIEPNQFGTDEFIPLCRKMGWTPMLTVNLGTGTPEEARDWVEYCNCPTGTRYADLRAANGSREPHGVKLWCLGNEMDGPWQFGHVPADQYAIRAQQAAKMMKDVDPSIELVACGSCGITICPPTWSGTAWCSSTWATWPTTSACTATSATAPTTRPITWPSPPRIDQQIEEMDAACRFVQAKRRRRSAPTSALTSGTSGTRVNREGMDPEGEFPPHLIEEVYNLEDALVVAGS